MMTIHVYPILVLYKVFKLYLPLNKKDRRQYNTIDAPLGISPLRSHMQSDHFRLLIK